MAPWRKAKQQFQLIFKFDVFFFLLRFLAALHLESTPMAHRRGHAKQSGVTSDSINLLSRKPKKRQWKVKAAPEFDEEDEETVKEVGWVWSTTQMPFGAFFIKNNFLIFFCGRCGGSNSISHSYIKAPFDSDKVYQLISDIVDKTFITDDEEDPYVSKSSDEFGFRQRQSVLLSTIWFPPFSWCIISTEYFHSVFSRCIMQMKMLIYVRESQRRFEIRWKHGDNSHGKNQTWDREGLLMWGR